MLAHAVHNQYKMALIAVEPYSMSAFYAAELGSIQPIMRGMARTNIPPTPPGSPLDPPVGRVPQPASPKPHAAKAGGPGAPVPTTETACREDAMICERCGKAEMYRMHAVWRCPECGFKTDCCGW
jgi:predicted RNA-binding Zn-ribbon protein involved in translation (DUF1610 family)